MAENDLKEFFREDLNDDLPEVTGEAPQEEPTPEPEEQVEEAAPEENGKIEEEPPSSEEKDNRIDPEQFKGYLDEREKRQKLEAQLKELQGQLDEQKAEPPPKIDVLEDPEGFAKQMQDRMEAGIRQAEYNIQRKFMARLHDDWSEAETWINEQLKTNEAIKAKLVNSDSILDDAYELFQQQKKLAELENVDELRAQIEKEVRAELEGKIEKEQETEAEKQETTSRAVNKPSLATQGSSTGVDQEGYMSLDDFVGRDVNNQPKP